MIVVEACDSSDNPGTTTTFDAGQCATPPCIDTTNPGTDASPSDGGVTDAADIDADPWADVDTNCAHYADQGGNPVTLRIRNNRTTPIYVGSPGNDCQFHLGFELHDFADASLTPALQIANRCSDFENNAACRTATCQPVIVTKIAPNGGTYDIGWPGTIFDARYMAKSCYADAGCATGPCMQERPSPAADIRVTSYPTFYCDGGSCSDCTNGVVTSCLVFGSVGGTSGAPTITSTAYDAGSGIYIIDVQPQRRRESSRRGGAADRMGDRGPRSRSGRLRAAG